MNCRQARQKLNKYNWSISRDCRDSELLSHLDGCPDCRALLKAEKAIESDIVLLRGSQPENDIRIETLKEAVAKGSAIDNSARNQTVRNNVPSTGFRLALVRNYAIAAAVVAFLILAFVPFNFKEKVGYEITIGGVDKDLVEENQDITPLLQALGMEQATATNLLDYAG